MKYLGDKYGAELVDYNKGIMMFAFRRAKVKGEVERVGRKIYL